jgi:glycosyltransferase involved in cell wall biosynthesis
VFTGEQKDPARFMQAMDVLCSSSKSEAFPNVIGEAMACALPCVVTDVGDCAAVVDKTGIIVPPSNSKALAEGLLKMLEKPRSERDQLGRFARSRIKEQYTLARVASRFSERYQSILAGASNH